jgi:hypothetical protein
LHQSWRKDRDCAVVFSAEITPELIYVEIMMDDNTIFVTGES